MPSSADDNCDLVGADPHAACCASRLGKVGSWSESSIMVKARNCAHMSEDAQVLVWWRVDRRSVFGNFLHAYNVQIPLFSNMSFLEVGWVMNRSTHD